MKENVKTYWFIFVGNSLLLKKDEESDIYTVPLTLDAPVKLKDWTYVQELPDMDGCKCKAFQLTVPPSNVSDFVTVGLRESYSKLPLPLYTMASKASELLFWNTNNQYCGVCGAPMKKQTAISKTCTNCGKEVWPNVAPAIIVRIRKSAILSDDGKVLEPEKILLVHARNFRRSEMYGLVAGFVETGETLEECVEREVWEEVHLKIKKIKYFGSQQWPYPCGIMIGFTADYDEGEIKLQDEELSRGGWFSKTTLPQIPDKMSIARKLIDDWIYSE